MSSTKNILAAVSHLVSVLPDGSPDWETSLGNIQRAIQAELEANRALDGRIEAELDKVFDKVPAGTGLPTPMVVQAVAAELSGGDFAQQAELAGKVTAYLERSKRFVSKRGRSGGLFRVA